MPTYFMINRFQNVVIYMYIFFRREDKKNKWGVIKQKTKQITIIITIRNPIHVLHLNNNISIRKLRVRE